MERVLYYVVEPQLQDVGDDILESNGWKDITVYTIEENVPKQFFQVECVEDNPEEAIQEYLDDNGYGDETFKMVLL
jgi:hypothetical protein